MKNSTNKKSPLSDYVKYSGLAFQMMATIALGVWGGMKIDQWTGWKFPVFMVTLPLLGIVSSLVLLIRSLPK